MVLIGYYFRELMSSIFGKKIVCPHCGTESHIKVTVFCKVLFLTFIPIWAGEKCIDINCQSCGADIDCYEYGNQELIDFGGSLQDSARVKWYYFIGLFPFIGYIGFILYDVFLYTTES